MKDRSVLSEDGKQNRRIYERSELIMALGGGTWLTQSKVLPGSYINFVSAAKASAALSDRGTVTMPVELSWGPEDQVFTVESGDFQKNSQEIFGYAYTDERMQMMREIFSHAKTAHFYRVNSGGVKASNKFASARYSGTRGNDLKIVITKNENYAEETNKVYDVATYLGTSCVDFQQGVQEMGDLRDNSYVTFLSSASLEHTASLPLTGGTDGSTDDGGYQKYLDKIESYSFNTMGCACTEETVKALFAAFTKRMREENGVKFQTVLFRYTKADHEGVISVENGLAAAKDDASLVYWTAGAEAACEVNRSLTNVTYDGELDVDAEYTQTQLEEAIKSGKLIFHKVNDEIRLLTDINTFVSVTDEKSADFSSNQTVRVLDQIGNDIAALFNRKYLGKVPNDEAGRISLWNDIVKHHEQLQSIRAIEGFSSSNVTVEIGDTKKSVLVTDYVTPVNAMEQLYMTVIVQ